MQHLEEAPVAEAAAAEDDDAGGGEDVHVDANPLENHCNAQVVSALHTLHSPPPVSRGC